MKPKEQKKKNIRKILDRLHYKNNKHGFDVILTRTDIEDLFEEYPSCYYCRRQLDTVNTLASDGMTIDRVDNNKGYTEGNMVLCCRRCNIIKGSWFTREQMIEIAETYLSMHP